MLKHLAPIFCGLLLALGLLQAPVASRFDPVTDPQLLALRTSCQGSGAVGYVLRVASTNSISCGAPVTLLSYRNRLINGNMAVNQRGVASASTAYSAGVYTVDRWRAGTNGVTMSLATGAGGDTTATMTAGTLLQTIEGSIYLPEGGTYVASWSGTATCRAYQATASGSYVASPLVITGWTAGTNGNLECQSGTLGLVQLEPGSTATTFERRDDELYRCSRYAQTVSMTARYNGGGDPYPTYGFSFHPKMRAQPSTVNIVAGSSVNSGTINAEAATSQFGGYFQVTGSGGAGWYGRVNLYTAEL